MHAWLRWPVVVSVGVLVLVALPGVTGRDSLPLSDYPMFARDRGREASFSTALGIRADGSSTTLSPLEIAGTDEPMQARAAVARAVADGRTGVEGLCAEVAARAASRADLVAVEVVTERHDVVERLVDDVAPIARIRHARCDLGR